MSLYEQWYNVIVNPIIEKKITTVLASLKSKLYICNTKTRIVFLSDYCLVWFYLFMYSRHYYMHNMAKEQQPGAEQYNVIPSTN